MDPWRYSTAGISVALRVTPRGGRDDIDGIETLADGRSVVKVRVRAIADGGEANRAVTELIAKALGVPKAKVRILSGTTSRLKQIAVDGDPVKLGDALRELTAAKKDGDDGPDHRWKTDCRRASRPRRRRGCTGAARARADARACGGAGRQRS